MHEWSIFKVSYTRSDKLRRHDSINWHFTVRECRHRISVTSSSFIGLLYLSLVVSIVWTVTFLRLNRVESYAIVPVITRAFVRILTLSLSLYNSRDKF